MKKYRFFNKILLFAFVLLSGCAAQPKKEEGLVITTSFYPMYVFTANIVEGAKQIKLQNMAPPQAGCLHDYQLSTGDMKLLSDSDIFIINGGGMESFLEKAISLNDRLQIVDTSKNAAFVPAHVPHQHNGEEPEAHTHSADEDTHDAEEEDNVHVWLSVPNAITQVQAIADALSSLDPKNGALYQSNASAYIKKLEAIAIPLEEIPSTPIKVGVFHEGFDYFAAQYHFIPEVALYADENELPTANALKEATDTIRQEGITVLFAAEDGGKLIAETLAAETGAAVWILDPVTDGPLAPSAYEQKMLQNAKTLKEALAP